ncbi:hypothetical protein HanRHA438_Chr10g0453421 [Helianthus annuus]|nr:hypothetical protein HanRHA438_Chr10g0453421 [Helianthus annuus]
MVTNHHKNIKELEKLLIRYHFPKFLFNSSDTGKKIILLLVMKDQIKAQNITEFREVFFGKLVLLGGNAKKLKKYEHWSAA